MYLIAFSPIKNHYLIISFGDFWDKILHSRGSTESQDFRYLTFHVYSGFFLFPSNVLANYILN